MDLHITIVARCKKVRFSAFFELVFGLYTPNNRKIDFRSFGDILRTIWQCLNVKIGKNNQPAIITITARRAEKSKSKLILTEIGKYESMV
jgi:hypothetical protein